MKRSKVGGGVTETYRTREKKSGSRVPHHQEAVSRYKGRGKTDFRTKKRRKRSVAVHTLGRKCIT